MADSHANECSVNSDLNTLLNYSETKNLHEEKNYPDRNDVLLSKSKLHLYWSGDFASLKNCKAVGVSQEATRKFLVGMYSALRGEKVKEC